jgi:hypothetical protein
MYRLSVVVQALLPQVTVMVQTLLPQVAVVEGYAIVCSFVHFEVL